MNKRSCLLDIHSPDGRAALEDLIGGADVLIESFEQTERDVLNLDPTDLQKKHPTLLIVSVTPYGLSGPKQTWAATELTIEAAGGLTGMQGDGDRVPLPVGWPQASYHAGVQAAADVLIALNERERSGRGQHLDVSAQAAVVWTLMNATGYPDALGGNPPGFCEQRATGRPPVIPGMRPARLLECADGYVVIGLHLPGIGERTMQGAIAWLTHAHPGVADIEITDTNWLGWMDRAKSGALDIALFNKAYDVLAETFRDHTKQELLAVAVERNILIAPVLDMQDLAVDPHLKERNFWQTYEGAKVPGPFAKLSRTPIQFKQGNRRCEPADIEPTMWPLPPPDQRSRERAFEGLKIADFA
jgi:benzylsuccinate CoA-transferase BbsE subunit